MFSIKVDNLHWLDKVKENEDLCLHGHAVAKIGDETYAIAIDYKTGKIEADATQKTAFSLKNQHKENRYDHHRNGILRHHQAGA